MEYEDSRNGRITWSKVSLQLLPILLMINIAFVGWLGITVVSLQTRVSVIEGNRFTSEDALEVWTTITDLAARYAEMEKRVSKCEAFHEN